MAKGKVGKPATGKGAKGPKGMKMPKGMPGPMDMGTQHMGSGQGRGGGA